MLLLPPFTESAVDPSGTGVASGSTLSTSAFVFGAGEKVTSAALGASFFVNPGEGMVLPPFGITLVQVTCRARVHWRCQTGTALFGGFIATAAIELVLFRGQNRTLAGRVREEKGGSFAFMLPFMSVDDGEQDVELSVLGIGNANEAETWGCAFRVIGSASGFGLVSAQADVSAEITSFETNTK